MKDYKALYEEQKELTLEKLNNLSNRYGVIEDKFRVFHYVIIKHDLDYTISELESELSALESDDHELIEGYTIRYDSAACDVCGRHPAVIVINEFGTFCKEHAKYI